MNSPTPGTCRFCGCNGDSCNLPSGDKCMWLGPSRTVCTNPACMSAHFAEVARKKAEIRKLTRRPNSAQIHELIRRKKRGKKGRAA